MFRMFRCCWSALNCSRLVSFRGGLTETLGFGAVQNCSRVASCRGGLRAILGAFSSGGVQNYSRVASCRGDLRAIQNCLRVTSCRCEQF